VKFDLSQSIKDHTFTVKVKLDQFKNLRDYEVCHNLINALSLEFDLDPEITVEDLKNIVSEAKNEEAEEINCDIGPEGIDIEF